MNPDGSLIGLEAAKDLADGGIPAQVFADVEEPRAQGFLSQVL